MDSELFPKRPVYPSGPIVTGRVVRLLEGYPRELKVRQPILAVVLTTAAVTRLVFRAIVSLVRPGSSGGSARGWKELRKGPEFLVTPLRLRDEDGVLCELEIHGHLPQSALQPSDHIQVTVRPQKDSDLPPKVERIVNITTRQLLTPRPPTLWSHLGPMLLFQALLGALVIGVVATYLLTAG